MNDQTKRDWRPLLPILRQVIFANRIYLTEHEHHASTPLCGAHYMIDIVGGAAVASQPFLSRRA